MTIGNVNPDFPVGTNMDQFDVGLLALGTTGSETPTSFIVTIGQEQLAFGGSNLTYDSQGLLTGGSIIAIQDEYQGTVEFNMSGFSISATALQAWALADDNASLNSALFSGADTLTGGPQSDLLHAYGGGDSISGGGGNDTIILSGPANETLSGGSGQDVVTTGGGSDVIVVGLHASGVTQVTADVITDWNSTDTLSFARGPTGPNDLLEVTVADFATATSLASNAFKEGHAHIVVAAIGSDVVVFADSANDNTIGDAVILHGATLSEISINNFTLSGSPTSPPPPPASPPPAPPLAPPPGPNVPTGVVLDPASDSGTKGDGITNVAQLTVDGVADPGANVVLLDGTTVVGGGIANATTGTFNITTTSALANGAHVLTVQATNAVGTSAASTPLNVTVDTTPPAAPTGLTLDPSADSGLKGDGITNIANVVVDGVAEQGAAITLLDGATVVGTATANATTGAFIITSTSALSSGAHTLNVETTDAAGNISPSASLNVTIDTTPPVAPSGVVLDPSADSGIRGDGITNVAKVVIDGVAEKGATVTLLDGATVVGTATASSINGEFRVTASSALTDGAHTLNVEATDAAGNVGPATSLNVTVDTTPPAAPTGVVLDPSADSGIKGDGITSVAKIVVDGVAEKGATVTLLDGATVVGTTTANPTTGAFSVSATSALSDGLHKLNVGATDAAGNVGPSTSLSVTVDSTPPVAPTGLALDPSADSGTKGDRITDVAKVIIDGVAALGATVTLLDGATVVGTAKANATTGAFSVAAASALSDGAHALNVEASDLAGNVGPSSSINVLIDTHPIGASISGFTETTSGGKSALVITGSQADPTSAVGVFEDGVSIGSVKPTSGAWSLTTANVTNAIHTFTTQTTDVAGDVAQGATTLILGSSGSDKIAVGAGNDIINGGGGVDTITAGSGSDVFVYNALSDVPFLKSKGSPVATINNFLSAADKLDLTHLGPMTYHGETSYVSAHEVGWYVSNGNTFVVGDADGTGRVDFSVELTGVHTLTAADFLLTGV